MKEIKSQNDRLLELQPSSQQREEFLVVVDYLLKFAYDEKHAVQSTKIVTYAKEQYNLYFRRDRVTQILIHLYQLSNNKQYNLPFSFALFC